MFRAKQCIEITKISQMWIQQMHWFIINDLLQKYFVCLPLVHHLRNILSTSGNRNAHL